MTKRHKVILGALASLVLIGGGCSTVSAVSSAKQEATAIEATQKRLIEATPIPVLSRSIERENIARRAKTFDVQNKVSYIYLVSYGRVMSFYTVAGKVSSLNSFLSPGNRIVKADGSPCLWTDGTCYDLEAPDIDGAYGENDGGIFFFTTDGAYVEWHGDYLFADQPLKLTTQPELIREIK